MVVDLQYNLNYLHLLITYYFTNYLPLYLSNDIFVTMAARLCNVLVCGGGVMGLSTAYHLTKYMDPSQILVVEKDSTYQRYIIIHLTVLCFHIIPQSSSFVIIAHHRPSTQIHCKLHPQVSVHPLLGLSETAVLTHREHPPLTALYRVPQGCRQAP